MKINHFLFLLCLISNHAYAQIENYSQYLDKNYNQTSREEAHYIRKVFKNSRYKSSTVWEVKEYFMGGQLHLSGAYLDPLLMVQAGEFEHYNEKGQIIKRINYIEGIQYGPYQLWYSNGQLKEAGTYSNQNMNISESSIKKINSLFTVEGDTLVFAGKGELINYQEGKTTSSGYLQEGLKEGKWTGYDSLAFVSFKETYKAGILLEGISVDSLGNEYTYSNELIGPEPEGGSKKLFQCLSDYLKGKYPKSMKKKGIQGAVKVKIFLSEEGTVKDFKLTQGVVPELDQLALYTVSNCKSLWSPAIKRGVRIPYEIVLPINFVLH